MPLDHDRPDGRKIELALVRDPAADPGARIGSLFLNPGGPGGSGVNFLRGSPEFARDIVGRRFDLIGFDPRGVGASKPAIDCKVNQETSGVYAQPFTRPDSDLAAHVRRARNYVNRCAALNGELMEHVSTGDVARDHDLLRAAVGDRKLSYVGISYGTMIGATYASLFPGKTRALVRDSAIDAETWAQRPFEAFREQSASDENVLDRFFAACARRQEVCGFGGEDPEDAFDDLAERLDSQPLPVPGTDPVDGDDLREVSYSVMYSQSVWPLFATALRDVEAGDGRLMREFVDGDYGRRPTTRTRPSTTSTSRSLRSTRTIRAGSDRSSRPAATRTACSITLGTTAATTSCPRASTPTSPGTCSADRSGTARRRRPPSSSAARTTRPPPTSGPSASPPIWATPVS